MPPEPTGGVPAAPSGAVPPTGLPAVPVGGAPPLPGGLTLPPKPVPAPTCEPPPLPPLGAGPDPPPGGPAGPGEEELQLRARKVALQRPTAPKTPGVPRERRFIELPSIAYLAVLVRTAGSSTNLELWRSIFRRSAPNARLRAHYSRTGSEGSSPKRSGTGPSVARRMAVFKSVCRKRPRTGEAAGAPCDARRVRRSAALRGVRSRTLPQRDGLDKVPTLTNSQKNRGMRRAAPCAQPVERASVAQRGNGRALAPAAAAAAGAGGAVILRVRPIVESVARRDRDLHPKFDAP
jgi:hypothetical protein